MRVSSAWTGETRGPTVAEQVVSKRRERGQDKAKISEEAECTRQYMSIPS